MTMTLIISLAFCTLVCTLRGGEFHNYLVGEAEGILRQAGFETAREHPESLPDGGKDFIDLMARKGDLVVCIEVETSARNVLSNAVKAQRLGRALVVLVPNIKVRKAVENRLFRHRQGLDGAICILMLDQFRQEVANCFPLFSSANGEGEIKQSNNQTKQISGTEVCDAD